MSDLRAYILCRFAEKSGIYNSWMDDCAIPCEVVDRFLPDWVVPDDAGIVITHMHYRWEEIGLLRRIYQQNRTPVLILADGILEYRNIWEHPDLADGAIFQPVIGHKLACIGRAQARIVESWGNVGKCEVVGLPRFDGVIAGKQKPTRTSGPFRLLIATANTPSFDQQQRKTVIDSLKQIKKRIMTHPRTNGRLIKVIWRLTDGLDRDIGVENHQAGSENPTPLLKVIDDIDGVITTPSTLYLESVLKGRPTAILDFHNSPSYLKPAWTINATQHFSWILSELANPPHAKMLFQRAELNDQLQTYSPAKPRLLKLIRRMVAGGQKARERRSELRLQKRILDEEHLGFEPVPAEFDHSKLYAQNWVYEQQDLASLQVELSHAIKRLETLPRELVEKNIYLKEATRQLDRYRARNAELRARVADLRGRLGIRSQQVSSVDHSSAVVAELSIPKVKLLDDVESTMANPLETQPPGETPTNETVDPTTENAEKTS